MIISDKEIEDTLNRAEFFKTDHDYFTVQTERFGLHMIRDLIARQVVGHNDFNTFDEGDWYEFIRRYRVVVAEAAARMGPAYYVRPN